MWFVAFYERSGVTNQSFVAVKQELVEPLNWLDTSINRDELDGYAVGDVVRAVRKPTGRAVKGEVTIIQPDGRYSVSVGSDHGYATYSEDEVQEVLHESTDGKPRLMGVIAHPERSGAVKIRNWVCDQFDQDPDLTHKWWDIPPAKLKQVATSLGEDLWISYDPLLSVDEFQQALQEM